MISVPVTLRSGDAIAPHETIGIVPFAESPLAVTPDATFSAIDGMWRENPHFQIVHRATGFCLGRATWKTQAEAIAVLERCDPRFGAWSAVRAGVVDDALVACRYKFRIAKEAA